MENWEQALEDFLVPWRELPEFRGSILSGSHALGTATPGSDVDVHILLSNEVDWRERGNRVVDGDLIEYFANPLRQFPHQMEADLARSKRTIARMLATGRILDDPAGEAIKLMDWANGQLQRSLTPLTGSAIEAAKYSLWDNLDGMLSEAPDSPSFGYLYPQIIAEAMRVYATVHGLEAPAPSKAYRFFTEPEFPTKYRLDAFPDSRFGPLFVACLEAKKEAQPGAARRLVEFVLESAGGFEIDRWSSRIDAVKASS